MMDSRPPPIAHELCPAVRLDGVGMVERWPHAVSEFLLVVLNVRVVLVQEFSTDSG